MSHTVRHKKMLLTRLKKIQGQSAALEKMLNREHECAEVYSSWLRFAVR